MSSREDFEQQVRLLVSILPIIDAEGIFALKGGTAINLFYRPFPRLSVDIDLLYLPMDDRETAWKNIKAAFARIIAGIKQEIPKARIQNTTEQQDVSLQFFVRVGDVRVKVELSPVIRGCVFPPQRMMVREEVEKDFGYAEVLVASHADVYAGKICAALDRQHPRDLFDVKQLYENEGLTEELRKTVLVFLISHFRPMSELLNPNRKEIKDIYDTELRPMTTVDVTLVELLETRERLVADLNQSMTEDERKFLLSFKNKKPDWPLLGVFNSDAVAQLPSVRWRMINLEKMSASKHKKYYDKLADILYPPMVLKPILKQ